MMKRGWSDFVTGGFRDLAQLPKDCENSNWSLKNSPKKVSGLWSNQLIERFPRSCKSGRFSQVITLKVLQVTIYGRCRPSRRNQRTRFLLLTSGLQMVCLLLTIHSVLGLKKNFGRKPFGRGPTNVKLIVLGVSEETLTSTNVANLISGRDWSYCKKCDETRACLRP